MNNKLKLLFFLGIFGFLLICPLAGQATDELVSDKHRPELYFGSPLSLRWEKKGIGILESDVRLIFVNPFDPLHILAATPQAGYQSFDGGATFSSFLYIGVSQQGISDVFFDMNEESCAYIAASSRVFKSCSLFNEWQEIFYTGSQSQFCYSVLTDNEKIYIGTSQGLFFRSKTEYFWQRVKQIPSVKSVFYLEQDDRYLYLAFSDEVYRLDKKTQQPQQIFSLYSSENDVDFNEYDQDQDEDLFPLRQIFSMSFVRSDKNTLILLTQEGFFMSDDRGNSWSRLPSQGLPAVAATSFLRTKEGDMLVATLRGVFGFFDGNWRQIYQGIETDQINHLAFDGSLGIFAGTNQGIFKLAQSSKVAGSEKVDYLALDKFFNDEPSINQVHQVAIQYAEVSPDKIKNWRRQAQQRGWLPSLSLGLDGYDRVTTSDRVWGSHTSGGQHYVGPDSKTFYENLSWSVRFSWNLGDLIWSSAQTSIDTRSKLMVELREKILNEVTRIYFERRRLQIERELLSPNSSEYFQASLRIQELTAFLDAFTGGWFSEFSKKQQ